MKTIEEINKIAPYHPLEWQEGYGIWQSGYMEGQKNGAAEQKAIDEDHLREVKKMLIDRAYSWLVHNLDDDRAFVVWRDFKKFMMEG